MELHLRLFLIILAFAEFVKGLNNTVENMNKSEYLDSMKRFKKAIEYTRWRMDAGTTEFIVKVLDDEIGTTKKIMAVNIDDITTEKYNVVVAGAMVPSPTSVNSIIKLTKEYTRFVPPTTVPSPQKDGEFDYIAPIRGPGPTLTGASALATTAVHSAIGIADLLGLDNRHPQRDDSPPSGPQFVSRQSPGVVHQVAPLGPVTIARLRTELPLKVSAIEFNEATHDEKIKRHIMKDKKFFRIQPRLYKEAHPGHTQGPNTPPRTSHLEDLYAVPRPTTALSKFFSEFMSMQQGEEKYISPSILHPNLNDIHRTPTDDYPDVRTIKADTNFKTFAFDKDSEEDLTTENIFNKIKKFKDDEINDSFGNSMEHSEGDKHPTVTETFFTAQKDSQDKPDKKFNDVNTYDMMFYKDDDTMKPEKKEEELKDYDEKFDSTEFTPPRTSYGYDMTNFTGSLDEYYESETRKSPDIQSQTGDKETERASMADSGIKEKVGEKGNLNDLQELSSTTKKAYVVVQSPEIEKKAREACNVIKLRPLNFNSARTLYEINSQLEQWSLNSPMVHRVDITHDNLTVMENPIYMIVVDDPTSGQTVAAKMTIMIVAGISGRDHHAVSSAMYFLYQLIERSEAHADLLSKYRFWVIPVFNPDGYEYSTTFPQRRQWVKNLQQYWDDCKKGKECETCFTRGIRCTLKPCYGVNLDRNFEYQWIPPEELAAEHPCGSLYAGERQLSEPETKALAKFFHEQSMTFYAFITFKEGDVLGVMYPYSHTKNRRTFDNVYRQKALRAASAAYDISGRPYVAGQTSEFLPLYAGGIEDWVDGHLGIDNVYTIMMFRAADTYNPKITIERVVHEAYAAIDTLLLQTAHRSSPIAVLAKANEGNVQTVMSDVIIMAAILFTSS